MLGLNPYGLLASVLVTIALIIGAYLYGEHNANVACDARVKAIQLALGEAQQKQAQAELIQQSNASSGFENDKTKVEIKYRTIHDKAAAIEHTNTIYLGTCFDDDGLRLANAALSGVPTASPTSKPDAAMPRPLAAH